VNKCYILHTLPETNGNHVCHGRKIQGAAKEQSPLVESFVYPPGLPWPFPSPFILKNKNKKQNKNKQKNPKNYL